MSQYIEDALPIVKYNGLNTTKNVDFSSATTVALPAGTTIAGTTALGATTITSSSATAYTVGPNGATNPVFNIDASTGSAAAGLNIIGATAAGTVAVGVISSGGNANLSIDAKGSGTIAIAGTSTGAVTITPATTVTGNFTVGASKVVVTAATGATTITSASASALAVGLAGATNPAFVVDSSTGSQAAGLSVTGATAAGNVAVAVISSGADANLLINAKGTGTIGIGSVSTGDVTITPPTKISGATNFKRQVTDTGGSFATPIALTEAQSGRVVLVDDAAGLDFTLPAVAAAQVGTHYLFLVTTTITSNSFRVTAQAGDVLVGALPITDFDTADKITNFTPDGNDLILTCNGSTTGGKQGSWVEFVAISATAWYVRGLLLGDGTLATPFS